MDANSPFRQPSNRTQRFSQIPRANISRSAFNLSHSHKGTLQEAGKLFPFGLYEVLPGDTFKIKPTVFVRLTTQLVPIMDNMYLDIFGFFVPNRLVWTNWQRFMGERDPDPDSSIDYTVPQISSAATGWPAWSTAAGFGLPVLKAATMTVSTLPFRGYNLIWNEWFRDQSLQDSLVVDVDDGPDNKDDYQSPRSRGKRHDYFTSALPWPQKGDAVDLPLGETAPVTGIGAFTQVWDTTDKSVYETDGTGAVTYSSEKKFDWAGGNDHGWYAEEDPSNPGFPNIRADLTNATAATINQLREAFQVQRLLERDARGGTRYTEIIRSHFGVVSPDARLQRPEFLGGDSVPFNQQSVAQTTFQGTETRLDAKGSLAANSVFISRGASMVKSFTEHGYIFLLMSIRADISYQQGIDRHFLRETRYDFYFPAFAHLGEQAIESREIYFDGTGSAVADPPTGDYSIFGYQERFAEMRFGRNIISGTLQSDATTTLDYWHLAQDFASRPTLSSTFIEDDPPIERITGITPGTNSPAFIFDAFVEIRAVRPMPAYSVPGLIDHF